MSVFCRYCARYVPLPCMNTRDMEDMAVDGDDGCFETLARLGGGEKGMDYVKRNRAKKGGC